MEAQTGHIIHSSFMLYLEQTDGRVSLVWLFGLDSQPVQTGWTGTRGNLPDWYLGGFKDKSLLVTLVSSWVKSLIISLSGSLYFISQSWFCFHPFPCGVFSGEDDIFKPSICHMVSSNMAINVL